MGKDCNNEKLAQQKEKDSLFGLRKKHFFSALILINQRKAYEYNIQDSHSTFKVKNGKKGPKKTIYFGY